MDRASYIAVPLQLCAIILFLGCSDCDPLLQTSPSGFWTASLSAVPGPEGDRWMVSITGDDEKVFVQDIFYDLPADSAVAMKWDSDDRLWFRRVSDRDQYTFWEHDGNCWNRCEWDITQTWEFYPPGMD